jgi:hypothetical protein
MSTAEITVGDLVTKAREAGAESVVASSQYGMHFILVATGHPHNRGGILHRDDAMPLDELRRLAESINQLLSAAP